MQKLNSEDGKMPINDGEEVLDALLLLGYAVEIADDGTITATSGAETLRGKATAGAIEWSDRSAIFHVRERAYISRLRSRVSRSADTTPPDITSPDMTANHVSGGRARKAPKFANGGTQTTQ